MRNWKQSLAAPRGPEHADTGRPMRRVALLAALTALAGCQLVETPTAEPKVVTPPPYPPGYMPLAGKVPEAVRAAIPAEIQDAQVLKSDADCFYYYVGASVFPIKDAASGGAFCSATKSEAVPIPVAVAAEVAPPAG